MKARTNEYFKKLEPVFKKACEASDSVGYLKSHGYPNAGWLKYVDEDTNEECVRLTADTTYYADEDGVKIVG